jgi:cytosine/adenosine deaminase-related metal-dependent hydrolase
MALVLRGTVVTFDGDSVLDSGAVYVDDSGTLAAVQPDTAPAPTGFASAPTLDTGGCIYPGLIDLHNHLYYNLRSLWAPADHPHPYTTRYQWPKDKSYKPQIHDPATWLWTYAGEEALKYVEAKALVGGVTLIQGASQQTQPHEPPALAAPRPPREGWLVRHVEFEPLVKGRPRNAYQSVLQLRAKPTDEFAETRAHLTAGVPFIYHLAEGTSTQLVDEFDDLAHHGCVQADLVGIHCTALTATQFQAWAPQAGSIIWSPLSNVWLYRKTTDVVAATQAGIRVCIGSDWSPSGSKNLLGELKVADLWNQQHLEGHFSNLQLCQMVTSDPADALSLNTEVGRIKAGLLADVLVTTRRDADPYRNLIDATEADVALVLVRGKPMYGLPQVMGSLGQRTSGAVPVGGVDHVFNLPDPGVPSARLGWSAIVDRLSAIQQHPDSVLTPGAAQATPPPVFRLAPDMPAGDMELFAAPGGPPDSIPPLDSLAPDSDFFAALAQNPILDHQLDGLAAYYGPKKSTSKPHAASAPL